MIADASRRTCSASPSSRAWRASSSRLSMCFANRSPDMRVSAVGRVWRLHQDAEVGQRYDGPIGADVDEPRIAARRDGRLGIRALVGDLVLVLVGLVALDRDGVLDDRRTRTAGEPDANVAG